MNSPPTQTAPDGVEERRVTLEEAFEIAQQVHRAGHAADAEPIYRAVLER